MDVYLCVKIKVRCVVTYTHCHFLSALFVITLIQKTHTYAHTLSTLMRRMWNSIPWTDDVCYAVEKNCFCRQSIVCLLSFQHASSSELGADSLHALLHSVLLLRISLSQRRTQSKWIERSRKLPLNRTIKRQISEPSMMFGIASIPLFTLLKYPYLIHKSNRNRSDCELLLEFL